MTSKTELESKKAEEDRVMKQKLAEHVAVLMTSGRSDEDKLQALHAMGTLQVIPYYLRLEVGAASGRSNF
jgi:hypothetical protein